MAKHTPSQLSTVLETQYDLRPDWMKPGFAEKAKVANDAYLEEIKNKQKAQVEFDECDECDELDETEDEDYFYKELFYKYLNTMIKDIPDDSQYYFKILFKIQRLDEELHPWNY